jgi:hypothetical protein
MVEASVNCSTARVVLTDMILRRTRPAEQVELAVQHASGCAACQARLGNLARAVRDGDIPCAEARAHFNEYHDARQARQDVVGLFPAVHRHLVACPACAVEYAWLEDMLAEAADEPLTAAEAQAPVFDLSFVAPDRVPWQSVGAHVRRLRQSFQVAVAGGRAVLRDVAAALQAQQPAHAYALRQTGDMPPALTIPDEAGQLRLHVGVGEVSDDQVTLLVAVEAAAEKPPSRVRVSLRDAEQRLLESQHTVNQGLVGFARLSPGCYWLVVQIGADSWEVPVPITVVEEASHD